MDSANARISRENRVDDAKQNTHIAAKAVCKGNLMKIKKKGKTIIIKREKKKTNATPQSVSECKS